MIEEEAKKFCQEKLMPGVKDAYNKEEFDVNIMK
jgi:hypothetical protein